MKFSLRNLFIAVTIICVALSFKVEGRFAYCEARGFVCLTQPHWNVSVEYIWSDDGFSYKYGPQLVIAAGNNRIVIPEDNYLLD